MQVSHKQAPVAQFIASEHHSEALHTWRGHPSEALIARTTTVAHILLRCYLFDI